jgi:hypothetical protein
MPARFTAPIELSANTLSTDLLRQRLAVVGPRYFGVERKVMDGARHLYDAWFYMGDSGTFFAAGTADPIARVIQGGLQCDDPEVRAVLVPAMVKAKLLPSSDREFAQLVAQQQGASPAATPASKRPAAKRLSERTGGTKLPKEMPAPKRAVPKKAVAKAGGRTKVGLKKGAKQKVKKTPAPKTKVATRPVIKKTAKKKPAPKKKAAKKTRGRG